MSAKPNKRRWFVWQHKPNIIYLKHNQTLFVIQRKDLNSCYIWLFLFNLHLAPLCSCLCPQALLIYVSVQEGPHTDPIKVHLIDFQAITPKLIENELQFQLLVETP